MKREIGYPLGECGERHMAGKRKKKGQVSKSYACDTCEHKENDTCPFGKKYQSQLCSDYIRFK